MTERTTARIVADVEPEVKVKLREIAGAKGETMAQFITNAIEKEYEVIFGKLKQKTFIK